MSGWWSRLQTCMAAVALLAITSSSIAAAAPLPSAALHDCAAPAGTAAPQQATAAQEGFDQAKLDQAIAFAASRMRTYVRVFRNNCLVGQGPLNQQTGNWPWNLFSSTKAVVSMLAGVAYTQGKLGLDDPIGKYLPPGMGDAAHRAITVRDLLTQTSGLQQSILSEASTAFLDLDPDIIKQTLALPLEHAPGTYFEYVQHDPDLLAYVIQRAVGQDLQSFAQRELFGPIGINAHDYYWARDRSGHTYGYAFLYMPPNDFSRLGLLMSDNGSWRGRRIIAPDYIDQLRRPSRTNACYGFLFWLNHRPCIGPSIPSRQTTDQLPMAGMPSDAYAMVGFLQQNNFIVPSLGLLVTWNGFLGDVSPDPSTDLSASLNSELYHDFFRKLAAAFVDPTLPDPGPYVPSFNFDLDPMQVANPNLALGALGFGPDAPPNCNVLHCGSEPLRAPLQGNPGCFGVTCLPIGPQTPHREGS